MRKTLESRPSCGEIRPVLGNCLVVGIGLSGETGLVVCLTYMQDGIYMYLLHAVKCRFLHIYIKMTSSPSSIRIKSNE